MSLSKFLTLNFQFEGRILPTRFARLRVASGDRRREATLTRTSLLFISVNTPWNRRDSNLKIAYLIFTLMICSETLTSVEWSDVIAILYWQLMEIPRDLCGVYFLREFFQLQKNPFVFSCIRGVIIRSSSLTDSSHCNGSFSWERGCSNWMRLRLCETNSEAVFMQILHENTL